MWRGKPSKGCFTCRKRKIKCDQVPDGCGQCAKAKRKCPGYRDELDLMFVNESHDTAKKVKARVSRTKERLGEKRDVVVRVKPLQSRSVSPLSDASDSTSSESLGYFSMFPVADELAISHFFMTHSIGFETLPGEQLGLYEDVSHNNMNELLLTCIKAVGLASLPSEIKSTYLRNEASKQYLNAIQLTNAALASPADARKDSTLIATIILSEFELLRGCEPKSIRTWEHHVNGAAAILKLRGPQQMTTMKGRRLFSQVATKLLLSCNQRDIAFPAHVLDLMGEAWKYNDPNRDIRGRVVEAMVDVIQYRSKIRRGLLSSPVDIVGEALKIDSRFIELFSGLSPDWRYQIVFTDKNPDIIHKGCYHVYSNMNVARTYNLMRTHRMILHAHVRGAIYHSPLIAYAEYQVQAKISLDIMKSLQFDILASVPQYLGYSPEHLDQTPPPIPFPDPGRDHSYDAFVSVPPPQTVIWAVCVSGLLEPPQSYTRNWILRCLRRIGRTEEIQQATIVADMLESGDKFKSLRIKNNELNDLDGDDTSPEYSNETPEN